jgi:hypothetical protein
MANRREVWMISGYSHFRKSPHAQILRLKPTSKNYHLMQDTLYVGRKHWLLYLTKIQGNWARNHVMWPKPVLGLGT